MVMQITWSKTVLELKQKIWCQRSQVNSGPPLSECFMQQSHITETVNNDLNMTPETSPWQNISWHVKTFIV